MLPPACSQPFSHHEWMTGYHRRYSTDSFLDGVADRPKVAGLLWSPNNLGKLGALKASCGRKMNRPCSRLYRAWKSLREKTEIFLWRSRWPVSVPLSWWIQDNVPSTSIHLASLGSDSSPLRVSVLKWVKMKVIMAAPHLEGLWAGWEKSGFPWHLMRTPQCFSLNHPR